MRDAVDFFDFHDAGSTACDACYEAPERQDCGGLLHNELASPSTYCVVYRCDGCSRKAEHIDSRRQTAP